MGMQLQGGDGTPQPPPLAIRGGGRVYKATLWPSYLSTGDFDECLYHFRLEAARLGLSGGLVLFCIRKQDGLLPGSAESLGSRPDGCKQMGHHRLFKFHPNLWVFKVCTQPWWLGLLMLLFISP